MIFRSRKLEEQVKLYALYLSRSHPNELEHPSPPKQGLSFHPKKWRNFHPQKDENFHPPKKKELGFFLGTSEFPQMLFCSTSQVLFQKKKNETQPSTFVTPKILLQSALTCAELLQICRHDQRIFSSQQTSQLWC